MMRASGLANYSSRMSTYHYITEGVLHLEGNLFEQFLLKRGEPGRR